MSIKSRIAAWYIARRVPKEAERMFGKNWKTSLGGLGMIFAGLGAVAKCFMDGHVSTDCLLAAMASVSGGVGLLKAKDHDVTGRTR